MNMDEKKSVTDQFVDEFKAGAFDIKYDSGDNIIKGNQEGKVESVQEAVNDINAMLTQREVLHNELLGHVESLQSFITNNMPSASQGDASMLRELMKKRIELEELKLAEKVNRWRDIANLKRELREHMKELRDRQGKASLLDRIMDD